MKEEPEWLATQRTGKATLSFHGAGECCQAWTRWEKTADGLLFATPVEFRRAMGSCSREEKVSVSAGQREEARKKEWTEKQEREGGMRANMDPRHGAETCDRTEFYLHHNHWS